MKKYNALTCEFITKSYKDNNGKSAKLFFKGYFLFDDQKRIYRQILQIKKDNNYNVNSYRHTDKSMLKTEYYKKTIVKEFRNKFLDLDSIDKNKYENKKENLIDLTDKKIFEINQAFITNANFTKTTLKTMVSYFTGSNPSGAELNWKNNPFIIVNNIEKYNGGNLLNAINKYCEKKGKWLDIDLKNINEINEYSIDEFMKLSPKFKNIFMDTNKQFFQLNTSLNTEFVENEMNFKKDNKVIINSSNFANMTDYYEYIEQKLLSQGIKLDVNNKNDISDKLDKYFKNSCLLKNKIAPYNNYYSIENDGGSETEKAHIIGRNKTLLKWIVNEDNFFKRIKLFLYGIKHLNCLNLTPNLHSNYDNNLISINPKNGRVWDEKNQKYLNKWVHKDELIDKREYLKENWKHFKQYKKNL
ncbi:MAG: hypothetical protein K2K73_02595 [Ureaplasma sp.]|nr:hypothetical protein [Ureaplasma sp.]